MGKIRILIADSHENVRTQLVARLQREPEFEIVGQAANSGQTLHSALVDHPDIILIDPVMWDGFGIANLRHIIAQLPDTQVVVLTAYADTSLRMSLRRMGVKEILTKGIASEELVEILRSLGAKKVNSSKQRHP